MCSWRSHLLPQQFIADLSPVGPQHFPSAQPPCFLHAFMHAFMSLPLQHDFASFISHLSLPQQSFASFASAVA